MIEIHTNNGPLDDAGRYLTDILKQQKGTDVLFLFSGGSSLAIVDRLHPKHIGPNYTLTMLDERFTFEISKSNFSKLEHTPFFKQASENGARTIDPRPRDEETLKDTAKRFDLALKEWHVKHREGVVVATVGIGDDGHTAGILPMPEDTELFSKLFQKEGVCAVGYTTTPEKNPHTERITTTLDYIERHVHHAIIYAGGIQKKQALQNTISKHIDFPSTPAQILQRVPDAHLFTDLSL